MQLLAGLRMYDARFRKKKKKKEKFRFPTANHFDMFVFDLCCIYLVQYLSIKGLLFLLYFSNAYPRI